MYKKVFFALAICSTPVLATSSVKDQISCPSCIRSKPSDQEVIAMVFASHAIPLSIHPSCKSVGTSEEDKNLGQYIAGLMAYMNEDMNNRLTVNVEDMPEKEKWLARFMLSQEKDETVWRYGLEFSISKKTGLLDKKSYRCIGA